MGCMAEPKICVIHSVSGGTPFSCLQRARPFDENRRPGFAPAGDLLSCLCKKARQRSTARFRAPSGFPPCGVVGRGASQTRPAGSNSEAPFSARHRLRLARQRAGRLCLAERLWWFRRVVSFAAHQATYVGRHNGGRQAAHPTTLRSARQRGMGCQPATVAPNLVGPIGQRRIRPTTDHPCGRRRSRARMPFPFCAAERSPGTAGTVVSLSEPAGRVCDTTRRRRAQRGHRRSLRHSGGVFLVTSLSLQRSHSPAGARPGQQTAEAHTSGRQEDKP